ncbi:hypothetical protein HRG_011611 [Hirsutella rhossiliensis]|uniref:Uncharacterized protein n=1 Tax=Hirsutella rhossiliensis TaxID=111463 RepID=A0A9P8MN58_9HYPO|nr:uncharacterized protein HRG_11611 [Hirsutella rhossiliensis]KAH0957464.1 hypothetical protein HRG_11611 [Hirsutella rhossiliensis]
MPVLHGAIVLQIVEYCDADTIKTLLSIAGFREIIEEYHTSIARKLIRWDVGDETLRGKFLLDTFDDLSGRPCSERAVIPVSSLYAIDIVERRVSLVEWLLKRPLLCTRNDSDWPHLNKLTERETMRQMVREALSLCDHLGDIEASVIGLSDLSGFDAPALPQMSIDHVLAHQWTTVRNGLELAPQSRAEQMRERYVRWLVRGRQRQYLKTLKTRQLLSIVLLLRLIGEGLPRESGRERDPERRWKLLRGVNECVLRHGTWFLSAYKADAPCYIRRHQHANDLIRHAKRGLAARRHSGGLVWQSVKRREVSVTLHRELQRRQRAEGRGSNVEVATEALIMVDEVIRGPQTVRPITSMFSPVPA